MKISTPAGGLRTEPTEWIRRYDEHDRLVEVEGPSHDDSTAGLYSLYEYYAFSSSDPNSMLPKRRYVCRDESIWVDWQWDERGRLVGATTSADFPELTSEDIRACLAFAADRERRLWSRPA